MFVCIYLFLLQHISRSNTSKGPLPLPSDLPLVSSLYVDLSSDLNHVSSVCTSGSAPDTPDTAPSSHQPAVFGNPAPPLMPIPTALPSSPIPFVPSQTISPSSSWGLMMTPKEVRELLALQPQIGEYYVVIKGRRPGVYLSW